MNILVINCGSSSLKYQLINSDTEAVLAKGLCERIGIEGSQITYQPAGGDKEVTVSPMPTHTQAIQLVLDALTNEKNGVIKSLKEVGAVGHRVVHGGEIHILHSSHRGRHQGHRRMQRSGSAPQPGKPDRDPRMPGVNAGRSHGSSIRYSFPSDNAGGGLSLRPSLRVL